MTDPVQVQLLISIITMLGSGVTVYVGVRVAIVQMQNDLKWHKEQISELKKNDERLQDRLDDAFGQRKPRT